MQIFKKNKILSEKDAISDLLCSKRREKKIKLSNVAKKLNINIKYLKALETANFNKLPKGIYGKNFLKEYAIFLGLDYVELLKMYDNGNTIDVVKKKKDIFSKQVVQKYNMLGMPRIIKSILVIGVVAFCLIYLGMYINKIISPPFMDILEPKNDLIVKNNFINIVGITEIESQVRINGELILIKEDGNFEKMINLKSGINIIIITAKKKYGRELVIKKQIMVEMDK